MNFEDVIFPLNKSVFLSNHLGKKPFLNKGNESKFSFLLEWNDINRIIQEHRLEHPRLRMFKDTVLVPETDYITKNPSRRGSINPIILTREFNQEILGGATLIIDAIQEIHKPIREFCEEFNSELQAVCQVNCYIALADQQCFDTHWDGHDVFVFQVKGEKYWKVYHPTRMHPLDTDLYQKEKNVEKTIFWEGVLQQGDMLYIPKGWWHTVSPVGKETIHLTLGYNSPTGVDYLKWIIEKLHKEEFVRAPSPLFSTEKEKELYTKEIANLFQTCLKSNSFDNHIEDRLSKLHPRIAPALPYSADPKIRILPKTLKTRPSIKNIIIKIEDNSFYILVFNKRYELSLEYLNIAKLLLQEEILVGDVIEKDFHSEQITNNFIINLMKLGVLQIC